MFIRTHAEAQKASEIASEHGYEVLTAERFFKREHIFAFTAWSSEPSARAAIAEIAAAIHVMRQPWRDPALNR